MTKQHKNSLLIGIAQQKQKLAEFTHERNKALTKLNNLESELANLNAEPFHPIAPDTRETPTSAKEKVELFRQLFKGRQDVFPRLWINNKSNKKGYSPACSNEWVPNICKKPKTKCAECPNQAFIPVSDQVILDHLQGKHVVGIYPILNDDSCWFLAVDFDKKSWKDDVNAFLHTCDLKSIPAATERSRSGDGAHVWFFFSTPVPAYIARQLGTYLITLTMETRHQLSMASYDRLFPSQDKLPQGGFGNLIALPLQYGPRQSGNTVFIDKHFQPLPDQWAFLASIPLIDLLTIERIIQPVVDYGQIMGTNFGTSNVDPSSRSWEKIPDKPETSLIIDPIPAEIRVVFAQQLFIEKVSLPSTLINQIKRLATFQNPEFYKKQNMRLSTALTPRVICCAEELPQHIALPRGCLNALVELLERHNAGVIIEDHRQSGDSIGVKFHGELTEVQQQACNELLKYDTGVFVAPPGTGKTVVGAYLVAQRQSSTLVLVHRRPLLDQWVAQLSLFHGISSKDIGTIGGGKRQLNGNIDVAMIQSLAKKDRVDEIVSTYSHIIVDECHHLPAVSFERVLREVKARYVTGLTATPQRRDGHHPIIEMQLGPIRYAVSYKTKKNNQPFKHSLYIRNTNFSHDNDDKPTIQALYQSLSRDDQRNEMIFNDVLLSLEQGRSPILLTERKDHLNYFAARLKDFTHNLIILHGGINVKQRAALMEQLAHTSENEERLILATGRYIGEGFDDSRLDTLFLALPVSWKGTLVQYTGRLHRLHPNKSEVQIYDYVDDNVPMLNRMFEKRLRAYRAIGYSV